MADTLDLPEVNLSLWLSRSHDAAAAAEEAKKAADSLYKYGLLIVRDPRVSEADNDRFLDMIERYFEQPDDVKSADVRAKLHYQVGMTPERVELPRNHCERMRMYKDADKPISACPPELDAKGRFFWRIGERPEVTDFPELNAAPVVPTAFPEWTEVMNTWGNKLLTAVTNVAEMAAAGMGLPEDAFAKLMLRAPHLLAPTASDLKKFGTKGTVLAGYHYDLNALTIHGRSRYPGLYVWTREGSKRAVKIPAGCLLVQAGKQLEYMTGGYFIAGFHEVVVTDGTLAAIEAARAAHRSLWRISSTLFGHFASDVTLHPVGPMEHDAEALAKYPPIKTGEQVAAELAAINLASTSDGAGGAGAGATTHATGYAIAAM